MGVLICVRHLVLLSYMTGIMLSKGKNMIIQRIILSMVKFFLNPDVFLTTKHRSLSGNVIFVPRIMKY